MRLALAKVMPRIAWWLGPVLLAACTGEAPAIEVCPNGAEYSTITDAINAAPPGTRIDLCPGIYSEHLAIVDKTLHLRGAGAGATILDAGAAGTAITIGGTADVTIEGVTIRAGAGEYGGGIHAAGSFLRLVSSDLEGNQAGTRGGALYLASDGLVEDTRFAGNTSGWTGGAIYVDGHAPVFRRVLVEGNASAHEGGGFYLHQSQAAIEDSEVRGNTSQDDGGGLRIFESEARLERNTIAGNHSATDGGGAKISHLPCVLIDNQIVDNVADHSGGGLELDNDSSQVQGGEVSRNQASRGGGIHVMVWPWDGGVIEDVRIADNHAWRGGGIHLEDGFQPATLRRLTIERNDADQGGGVYATGAQLVFSNSLVTGNDADEGGGLFLVGSEPWEDDCPCPPVDPPDDLDFLVVHGNTGDTGTAIWAAHPALSIESSIISGHAGLAVAAQGRAPSWRFNDVFPDSFAGMQDPTGSAGNLSTEPNFTAAGSGDFRLQEPSACIDAGNPDYTDPDGSRADMGLHAGPGAP